MEIWKKMWVGVFFLNTVYFLCSYLTRDVHIHYLHKCKKHSLSHQLKAQLHIENSKNKKNGDNTIAAYRLNVDSCKRFITIFLFLLFSMCNCAVNRCDKLCFLHLYLLFYCQFSIFVTRQGEVGNSRIVTEPTLLYFHFYLCGRWNLITNWYQSWPLVSRNVTNLTIQGHATSSFTWPFNSQ